MSHSTSVPDPSKPIPSATGTVRAKPDDASFETHFADLAARFAAQSGGGLSPELSADLALEIVLNEIVERACLATGATGAAIVLQRDGEMVCRARSGSTAPELGSRLDAASGLSGECIRTRRTQRCQDVLADQLVDLEASRRLGVRSVVVMPLLRGTELAGVFELFSSQPHAFGEGDDLTLEALSGRILSNLERAAQPPPTPTPTPTPTQSEPLLVSESLQETIPKIPESSPRRGVDWVTRALGLAVLACAVLLGVLVGRHLGTQKAIVHPHPAPLPSAAGNASAVVRPPVDASVSRKHEGANAAAQPSTSAKANETPVPPGGLLVFENGKEIFRIPPAQNQAGQNRAESSSPEQRSGVDRASSVEREQVVELSPAAEGSLLHRVEPEYPEDARQQHIQGAVVLEVHIGGDGAVQEVHVVSGPAQLAQASTDAVKQWRFQPRSLNGRAAEMQTRITLNFRLPQ
jgi:TonB family protein